MDRQKLITFLKQNAQLAIGALEEDERPEDHFAYDTEEENLQTAADIRDRMQHSEWAWCCIKVEAYYRGWRGSDYLGCCSYESERDFIECGDYYADMCDAAINELADEILTDQRRIKQLESDLSNL